MEKNQEALGNFDIYRTLDFDFSILSRTWDKKGKL